MTGTIIYLVVGTPGSGKTWVCKQLEDQYDYLAHDDFRDIKDYISNIARLAQIATKPILIETPFSVSQVTEGLGSKGLHATPVFIIESDDVTSKRYEAREGRPIPKGHLSRINTYYDRARSLRAFYGTSEEVLAHLKACVLK